MTKLAYGLVALVALTTLTALAPAAAADPITVEECDPLTTNPRVCHGLTVRVDPDGPCLLYVWLDNTGGIHCFP